MMNITSTIGLSNWLQTHQLAFILITLWSFFWTALGLWHSAKRGHFVWFIIFLLVHTLGIFEIIYLFGILKLKFSELFKN